MITQSFSLSDLGRRKNNEDFAAFFEPSDQAEFQKSGCLYIVADGVGGAAKGERASQFAAQKLLYEYYQPENADLEPLERLRLIMEHANAEIYSHASENHTRMATTMVVAVVRGEYLFVANVGDSRAYLIRDGAVKQVNRDHSIVGEMVEHNEMTEEEAMASKIKNRLTRSLGGDPEVTVDVYTPIPLKVGDKILLCSDGLTRYATLNDIVRRTAQGKPEEISKRLVQFANQKGGADNISVITIFCQPTGALEPNMIAARPQQVELDTLVTQPDEKVKISKRKKQPIAAVIWLVLFVGGIFAALMLGGMVFFDVLKKSLSPTPVVVSGGTETMTSMPTVTLQFQQGQPQLNSDTPSPTLTSTPTKTYTITPTETLTITPTFTPTNENVSSKICISQITSDHNALSLVLQVFNLKYDPSYAYERCNKVDLEVTRCEGSAPIPPPDYVVRPAEWIIIPVGVDACTPGVGRWVLDVRP